MLRMTMSRHSQAEKRKLVVIRVDESWETKQYKVFFWISAPKESLQTLFLNAIQAELVLPGSWISISFLHDLEDTKRTSCTQKCEKK